MTYDVKRWVDFSKKWPETLGLELVGLLPEFAGGGTIVLRIKSELVDQLVEEPG